MHSDPTTELRVARLRRLVDTYEPYYPVDLLDDGTPWRFLLVERERQTGQLEFTMHDTLTGAADYWDQHGDIEYWDICGAIDLDTGERYRADTTTTFAADPHAAAEISDDALRVPDDADQPTPADICDHIATILAGSGSADSQVAEIAAYLADHRTTAT